MPKILIAEDDARNVKLLTRLFERQRYEYVVAKSRDETVAMAISERPDLILMDIKMPPNQGEAISSTAGLEATKELKSMEQTHSIPIIATSASDLPEDRNRFREAGCDDIQPKPFTDFQVLLERVRRNLEGKTA